MVYKTGCVYHLGVRSIHVLQICIFVALRNWHHCQLLAVQDGTNNQAKDHFAFYKHYKFDSFLQRVANDSQPVSKTRELIGTSVVALLNQTVEQWQFPGNIILRIRAVGAQADQDLPCLQTECLKDIH